MTQNYEGHHWLPLVQTVRSRVAGKELAPKSLHHLTSCLRMAFCEAVCIHLSFAPGTGPTHSEICDMVFHDLVAPNTFVGTLTVMTHLCSVELATRGIEAFKSVKTASMEWDYDLFAGADFLDVSFFVTAMQHGVRCIDFKTESDTDIPADTAAALSFGFADPTAGGDRSLLEVACDIGPDFLEQVKQKVADLDEARHVDFTFKLANIGWQIDSTGFKKYQKDEGRTWLINDLENHVNVEVKQNENLVEIHVFSSG
ncbi:hypothetical protein AAVH_18015 [Aphelenchoides avenae]|nr:hypothetical protein AAVH_18015 [Aphelenchus avenae]